MVVFSVSTLAHCCVMERHSMGLQSPSAGLSPVCPGLSFTGGHRTGHSTAGVTSPMLSTAEGYHFWLAGNTHAAKNTISLLGSKGTLLTHVQVGVHQDLEVLLCKAAFQMGGPQYVLMVRCTHTCLD